MEIFNQRILPIFKSEKPSSCVQCHLSSVDLRDYILPSAEKTFVSLRDQGLIDLDAPENSKILKLIRMGDKDADEGARLIHAKMRQAEYEAFAAWIAACAKVYIDRKGKLDRDPSLLLGDEEFAGQLEMNVRRWRPGFKNARRVSGESLADQRLEDSR